MAFGQPVEDSGRAIGECIIVVRGMQQAACQGQCRHHGKSQREGALETLCAETGLEAGAGLPPRPSGRRPGQDQNHGVACDVQLAHGRQDPSRGIQQGT